MPCTNIKLITLVEIGIHFKINSSFKQFPSKDLFIYTITMKDESIMKSVAKYCFETRFLTREGSKRCNLCLEEKLSILKRKAIACLTKDRKSFRSAKRKRVSGKNLNRERNACYFNDHTPTFMVAEHCHNDFLLFF